MSFLTELSIEGMRGIRSGKLASIAQVNVLVGKNNCGKTTVLEALERVRSPWAAPDVTSREPLQSLLNRRNEKSNFDEKLFHRPGVKELRITVTLSEQEPVVVMVRSDGKGSGASMQERFKQSSTFWPSDANDRQIENALFRPLLERRADKALIHSLNKIFDLQVEQIQVFPDGKLMLVMPDVALNVDSFGDGTRAALRCLMVAASLKGGLFSIEEPECHQHPESLRRFAQALMELAEENDLQLFITTHSDDCLLAFARAATEAKLTFQTHHLSNRDGLLTSRALDAQTVETLMGSGTDIRFLDSYV